MVTGAQIEAGLRKIGLGRGDVVVVHASLSSFGRVKGGAQTVVGVLLEVIGAEGTLIVPTFTYGLGVFDPGASPSVVGAISEAVRTHPNALRSLHPTHSVAAVGELADVITDGHEKTHAFARGSALFKALQARAKILQLGVTHTSNSIIHVAEEIAGLPYLDRSGLVRFKNPQGKVVEKWLRRPGCSQGFDVIEEILDSQDAIRETMIGECRARLMSARSVVDAALEALKFDPQALLCERPDCEVCAQARAMVEATEAEKLDKEIIDLAEEEERMRRIIENRLSGGEVKFFDAGDEYTSPN
ncbi:MAG: AAC(3) family N-acetyltransferase [Armatimonadota bacterium]|nr:AAC(3) family N-acetyltransferase [bacterium]